MKCSQQVARRRVDYQTVFLSWPFPWLLS